MQKRAYADLNHGQIHYRMAGNGPTILLLHQSPCSSKDFAALIEKWSSEFSIIAPDTPGNGMSDPLLMAQPTINDYGDVLIEFLDFLEIDQAMLYGYHTGASIGVSAAARYPQRIPFAVANGLSILEGDMKKDFLKNYLPPIEFKENGSHLSWLWQRIRKQAEFFPWYSKNPENKLNIPPYSTQKCQTMLVDLVMAGNNYIAPYYAAFAYHPIEEGVLPAPNLTVCTTEHDPLYPCFLKLPKEQPNFISQSVIECEDEALKRFQQNAGGMNLPPQSLN